MITKLDKNHRHTATFEAKYMATGKACIWLRSDRSSK